MQVLHDIIINAQTPVGGVFILSALILGGFLYFAPTITKESPFASYALPIVGVMILIPATMFLGVTKTIDANAVSAVLGAVVAYIFGAAKPKDG